MFLNKNWALLRQKKLFRKQTKIFDWKTNQSSESSSGCVRHTWITSKQHNPTHKINFSSEFIFTSHETHLKRLLPMTSSSKLLQIQRIWHLCLKFKSMYIYASNESLSVGLSDILFARRWSISNLFLAVVMATTIHTVNQHMMTIVVFVWLYAVIKRVLKE